MRSLVFAAILTAFTLTAGLAQTDPYEVVEITAGGSIAGHARLIGEPPAHKQLVINTDIEVCGGEDEFSRALLVGDNGGIRDAVVSLINVRRGKNWPVREYNLGQARCRFEPHVLLVPADEDLHLVNLDRIAHNIRSYGAESSFNVGQPRFVERLLVEDFNARLSGDEVNRIGCAFHNWMRCYIIVQQHPYYEVTDANGLFALTDVPPGKYKLKIWHETLGEQKQDVTVRAGEETRVEFELPLDGAPVGNGGE